MGRSYVRLRRWKRGRAKSRGRILEGWRGPWCIMLEQLEVIAFLVGGQVTRAVQRVGDEGIASEDTMKNPKTGDAERPVKGRVSEPLPD